MILFPKWTEVNEDIKKDKHLFPVTEIHGDARSKEQVGQLRKI